MNSLLAQRGFNNRNVKSDKLPHDARTMKMPQPAESRRQCVADGSPNFTRWLPSFEVVVPVESTPNAAIGVC
jgi:hypothetical protein